MPQSSPLFRRLRLALPGLALAALLAAVTLPAAAADSTPPHPDPAALQVGHEAPDFTLRDIDGAEHHLRDARGSKLVLIFFRGSW